MKKIYNFIKSWSFLLMWFFCGIIFLGFFDTQDVYADMRERLKIQNIFSQINENMPGNSSGGNPVIVSEKNAFERMEKEGELSDNPDAESEAGMEEDANDDSELQDMENETNEEGGSEKKEFVTVEDDYFEDALFIGDSRTVGMFEYGGLEEIATFYASKGLTIYTLMDAQIVSIPGQREKVTIREALEQAQFKKIYLMVGINELGTGDREMFVQKYSEVVDEIQNMQPDSIVYIQAIMKVTSKRSAKGDYITNEGIEDRNEGIRELADNVSRFYLDANEVICDESGGMQEEYTTDGVHLKAQYILLWKEYLKEHAILLDGA